MECYYPGLERCFIVALYHDKVFDLNSCFALPFPMENQNKRILLNGRLDKSRVEIHQH
jgi:hypothetical protein